jgi:hypothetical protein
MLGTHEKGPGRESGAKVVMKKTSDEPTDQYLDITGAPPQLKRQTSSLRRVWTKR